MCMDLGQKRRHSYQSYTCALLLASWLLLPLTDALEESDTKSLLPIDHVYSVDSSDFDHLIEARLNDSASSKLLSRQRRYLIFPEGSSFQMVFDEIICVVDYTNYLVVGVTAALAWELPSQPPGDALENLLTKLNDGTLDISRKDSVSNITYVDDSATPKPSYKPNYINFSNAANIRGFNYNSYYDSSSVFRPPMHISHQYGHSYYRPRPRPAGSKPARRKDHYFYSVRNPFKQRSQSYSPVRATRFPYWALPSHIKQRNKFHRLSKNKLHQRSRGQKTNRRPSGSTRQPPQKYHRIFPVYGKRSIPDPSEPNLHHRQRRSGTTNVEDEHLTRMEGNQIKYHRNSRQKLYERIEKYLDKRGQNGHQCVLRTLCETGQKSGEREPGSFVREILRAVFTIPEALEHEPMMHGETHYDRAHAHTGDCAAVYPECKQSIWDAPFVQ